MVFKVDELSNIHTKMILLMYELVYVFVCKNLTPVVVGVVNDHKQAPCVEASDRPSLRDLVSAAKIQHRNFYTNLWSKVSFVKIGLVTFVLYLPV